MKTTEYKDSEVGRIPADWTVKQIGKMGYTYSGLTGKNKEDFGKGEARYITFLNVLNNPILKTDIFETVDVKEGELQNKAIKGDLFFNTSSETPEEVGICALLNEDISNLYLNSFCFGYRLIDTDIDGLYLSYYFRSKQGRDIMSALAQGATRYNLSKEYFNKTLIAFPTIDEQKKVAKALSEIDSLLCKQNEEIEKKRMIKDGLMQELLTGKKRLKGFSGKWETVKLNEIAEMSSGGTPSSKEVSFYGGDIPFLSISDMTSSGKYIFRTEKTITKLGLENSSARVFPPGTLMYAMYASLGKCSITNIEVAISQAILGFKLSPRVDKMFLYYHFCYIEESVKKIGQTGTQSNLSKQIVENFALELPEIDEQKAIGRVLSDIDLEISTIESMRDKYLLIKQGMMQQLLTGKTRL